MRKNPRTAKIEKVTLKEVSSDTEASENSISDEPNSPENEAIEYEKQRKLRIAENNARMEAMGLHTIANSLMKLGGKRKRGVKNGKEDDEYEPTDDDDEVKDDDSDSRSSDEFGKKKKMKKKQKQKKEKANATTSVSQRVRNRKLKSDKQKSLQKQLHNTELTDEDDALKQAIALSLNDFGQTSDLQHAGLSRSKNQSDTMSRNEKRKTKIFKSRVQMTEDDLVINFCQFDEVGKGNIALRDLQRMANSHDFIWTDKELADMVRCFDSDRDGKLSLDDFRHIVLWCNMLLVPENPW